MLSLVYIRLVVGKGDVGCDDSIFPKENSLVIFDRSVFPYIVYLILRAIDLNCRKFAFACFVLILVLSWTSRVFVGYSSSLRLNMSNMRRR